MNKSSIDQLDINELRPWEKIMKEGEIAFLENKTLDDNPYRFNDMSWRRWNRGWANAKMGKSIQY